MGYLNPAPTDEYRIASQAADGTTDAPGAGPLKGLLTAIPKGLVGATEKVGSAAGDVLGQTDLGQEYRMLTASTDDANGTFSNLGLPQPVPLFSENARKTADAANQVVAQWSATGQDPRVTGTVGRIAAGTTEGLAIAGAGAAAGGPWGAAALLGSTEGYSDYLQGKADGLDDKTAAERAGVTGVASAASAFVPMKFGQGLVTNIGGGAAANLVIGAGTRAATSAVLSANGYKDMAAQYRVFDSEAMTSDILLGAAFGGMGHFMHPAAIKPADVDAALAVQSEEHFNRSSPGIPTNPEVANVHTDVMRESIDALSRGDEPNIPAESAQMLVDQALPDPNHDTLPMMNDAASTELPHYTDAIKPVDAIEPPERATSAPIEPLPKPEPKVVAEGSKPEPAEPPPVQLDDMTLARINNVVSRFGDTPYTDESGNTTTFRQAGLDMQAQMADADKLAKAHEVAAACFISTGSAA